MAGHNKWSKIKHKKAATDAKKGAAFGKLIKEITVTAKDGGGDPDLNSHLRFLLEKAKGINMPQENAIRAIKKGTGELPGVSYEECLYEGYGPHGIAILLDVLTDNTNRTFADLRKTFSKNNGTLAEAGAVNWMFDRLGAVHATGTTTEDDLLEALLDFEIQDIQSDGNDFSIYCNPKAVVTIKKAVVNMGLTIEDAGLEWVAKNPIELSEKDSEKVLTLLSVLDDHDDVQNVYSSLA